MSKEIDLMNYLKQNKFRVSLKRGGDDNMIYLIIKHGFDIMENHNPKYEDIYGYVTDKEEMTKIVNEFNNRKEERYFGYYDKTTLYPYLSYKTVKRITL